MIVEAQRIVAGQPELKFWFNSPGRPKEVSVVFPGGSAKAPLTDADVTISANGKEASCSVQGTTPNGGTLQIDARVKILHTVPSNPTVGVGEYEFTGSNGVVTGSITPAIHIVK